MSDQVRPPYRVEEAAERLNVTPYQVRQAVQRGELDGFRIGRTVLIRPKSLDRLLRGATGTQTGDAA